jgi:hypothetical protein
MPEPYDYLDQDSVIAVADLAGRTGGREFEIGYTSDEGPPGWYAHVKYAGARIFVGEQPGPVEAADALARRLLSGGALCTWCRGTVVLSGDQQTGVRCRWRRMGPKWIRGCEVE